MRRSPVALCVLLTVAVWAAAVDGSQAPPDFSGRWVRESVLPPGDAPTRLVVRQSIVQTNVRGEPMAPFVKDLTVTRESSTGVFTETLQLGVVGGSVPGSDGGPRSHCRVAWEDTRLVIETGTFTGSAPGRGDWTERREVWAVGPDGLLHVSITHASSGGASRTVTVVYRRVDAA
jgi:hypothetical protein